jgi:uridine kinase
MKYWDFTIFVEAAYETNIGRAEQRDVALFGSVGEVRERYEQRYIPGQKLYIAESRPKERAQVVVDNNDPWNPGVL